MPRELSTNRANSNKRAHKKPGTQIKSSEVTHHQTAFEINLS